MQDRFQSIIMVLDDFKTIQYEAIQAWDLTTDT